MIRIYGSGDPITQFHAIEGGGQLAARVAYRGGLKPAAILRLPHMRTPRKPQTHSSGGTSVTRVNCIVRSLADVSVPARNAARCNQISLSSGLRNRVLRRCFTIWISIPGSSCQGSKEPHYFASEVRPENLSREYRNQMAVSGLATTWQDYLALFAGATDEVAIGEASVCYLWSPTAALNIFARIPNARIIAVLRHPADRAWSQYLHCVANGYVRRSFREQIDSCVRSRETQFSPTHPFLELGMYSRQIAAYLDLFPRENIRIYFYQDGLASIVGDVFRFLNVDCEFRADLSRRHLEAANAEVGTALFRMLQEVQSVAAIAKSAPAATRPLFRKLAFRGERLHP